MRLVALDTAFVIEDLKLPGFDLHALEGNKKGIWSIKGYFGTEVQNTTRFLIIA